MNELMCEIHRLVPGTWYMLYVSATLINPCYITKAGLNEVSSTYALNSIEIHYMLKGVDLNNISINQ